MCEGSVTALTLSRTLSRTLSCSTLALVQVLVGVVLPREQRGFWLGPARASVVDGDDCAELQADRLHPTTGLAVCHMGQRPSVRSDGAYECTERPDTSPELLYACVTGMEFYECEAEDACEGGSSAPHPVDYTDPVDTWLPNRRRLSVAPVVNTTSNSTCREGHESVLCAQCSAGYVLNKDKLCEECPESTVLVYLAVAALVIGALALYWYVDGGGAVAEDTIKEQSGPWCSCCRCGPCKPRTLAASQTLIRKRMRRTPSLAQYLKSLIDGVIEQPDKAMLLISFVQVRHLPVCLPLCGCVPVPVLLWPVARTQH